MLNKLLVIAILPVAVTGAVVGTLWREIGRAFRSAWLEARIEITDARRYWQAEPFTEDDE